MPHRPTRGRRGRRARETAALAAALLAFHTPHRARAAGTFAVTTAADTGPGSLRQAILDADAAGGGTINMNPGGPIFLTAALPIVSTPMTINGGNALVHGNFTYRVFFVDVANGGAVALNNLTIGAGRAHGGNGGLGGGGGGGLGAGGGLFVNRGNVTVSNVSFQNNAAIGGTGGAYGGAGPGGGGGLGGNGGTASGGGGGYAGAGGNGNVNGGGGGGGLDTNGENASGTFSGRGGGEGGVGPAYGGGNNSQASPPFYDMRGAGGGGSLASPGTDASFFNGGSGGRFGGGGAAGQSSSVYGRYAGNGGEFGGGGSGARGGNGGFGGGGGVGYFAGGVGGFGGGGGGANAYYAFGAGGAFAGDGGLDETGGGGAALGAHIFVRGGASLTLLDSAADRGTVTPGAGAAPGPSGNAPLSGQAAGESFFLSGITPLAVSGTNTRTIGGSIADVGAFLNHPTASGFSYATLVKTGTGALVLSQSNAYRGGTVISQGTISHDGSASTPLGPGTVTFNDAATGAADTTLLLGFINTDTFVNPIVVADFGSGTATLASIPVAAQPLIFTGPVTLNRNLTVRAQNANPLTPQNEPGQTRFDGLVSGPGGLTITGGRMLQFRNAAKTYAGRTLVTDNSTLSLYSSSSTPANSTVQIDPGSTVVLEGLAAGVLGGLAGAGTLTHNPAWGATSTLEVGRNNQDTAFTGQITGAILLTKAGTGTLDLGAQDNTTIFLTVAAGRVRLTADQHLQNMRVNDTDPGVQTLDLNGHAMRFNGFAFAMVALEDFLNRHVGTAADGLYDSTAPAHPGSAIGIAFTPATGEAVRMKLTLTGDANLDGKVDFNDLVALAQHYNTASATTYWDNGDFTYDRRVDFNDLVLLAQSYNGTFAAAPIPGATSDFNHDLATAFATVPEPGTFAVIAAACGLTGATRPQKRRRHAAPNRTKAPQ